MLCLQIGLLGERWRLYTFLNVSNVDEHYSFPVNYAFEDSWVLVLLQVFRSGVSA